MLAAQAAETEKKKETNEKWPQFVPDTTLLMRKFVKVFHEKISSESLTTFTCAPVLQIHCQWFVS